MGMGLEAQLSVSQSWKGVLGGEQKWAPGKEGSSDISFEARRAFGRGLQTSMGGLEDASPPRMGVHFDLEHFPKDEPELPVFCKKKSG